MRKTFSGKTEDRPVKESKTKLKHSPYIQYTCMLDDEISELLNDTHHETTFNVRTNNRGLNPTFSRKSSKFGKKKEKKSPSHRQISKLRHALAIEIIPMKTSKILI